MSSSAERGRMRAAGDGHPHHRRDARGRERVRHRREHEVFDGTCPNGGATADVEPLQDPPLNVPIPGLRALDHLCAFLSSSRVLTEVAKLAEHGFTKAGRSFTPRNYADFENLCFEGLASFWASVHNGLKDPFTFSAGSVRGYGITGIKFKIMDAARRRAWPSAAEEADSDTSAVVTDKTATELVAPLEWMLRAVAGASRASKHSEQTRQDAAQVLRYAVHQAVADGTYDEFLDIDHLRAVLSAHDPAALRDEAGKERVRRVQKLLVSVVRSYAENDA
ncbi:hypothetical protein AB0J72_30665 [Dactylosporangium sp. NPDC049742]|uniref:hypothetical protein n=1 Tax=Dactylosporangium sp. NPDC049742 TaxID=3154737 RepID=UPI00341CA464